MRGQMKLLGESLGEAYGCLKSGGVGNGNSQGDGEVEGQESGKWFEEEIDPTIFQPALPWTLSFHLGIQDAALVLHLRTLAPVYNHERNAGGTSVAGSGTHTPTITSSSVSETPMLSLRQRLGLAEKLPVHDESGEVFTLTPGWHGLNASQGSIPHGGEINADSSHQGPSSRIAAAHPAPNPAPSGLSSWFTAATSSSRSPSPAPPPPLPPSSSNTQGGNPAAGGGGGITVKVREKIRVESQDPALMAVMAKLSALRHRVEGRKGCLGVLMGE